MKIVMLYPGYGSQFVGMAKELYDEHRIVQEYFEEAGSCLEVNFVKLAFASSDADLSRMNNAYTTLFVVSSAITALLKQEGIEPTLVAGYNNGEYSALFAAGGMSFPDGLYLLNKYASLYQESLADLDVAMIRIIGADEQQLNELCVKSSDLENPVYIALYETDHRHIIAGPRAGVHAVAEQARTIARVKIEEVGLEYGLHSPLMSRVADTFKMYLEKVDFKDLTVGLINNTDVYEIKNGIDARAAVISFIERPVLWNQIMDALSDTDLFIEVGPGSQLTEFIKVKYPHIRAVSINTKADLEELKKVIAAQKETEQPPLPEN